MLGAFLIFFREALEASMICSIMLAYLKQLNRRDRFRDVWYGVIAAIVVAMVGGMVVFAVLRNYDGSVLQTRIEGITYVVAMIVLTYMTFWMKKQGRHMKRELHQKVQAAVTTGSTVAIALISFVTVGREGLETVVFMIAIAFHTNPWLLSAGAAAGLAIGLTLSYSIYVVGRRINLAVFFDVMGTLLMLFAAGLLSNSIQNFQELGWIPHTAPLWSTAHILSEDSTFGDILHSFFGYADEPTLLQVIFYVLYWVVFLTFFWRRGSFQHRRSASSP